MNTQGSYPKSVRRGSSAGAVRSALALLSLLLIGAPASADIWQVDGSITYSNGAVAANAQLWYVSPSGVVSYTRADGNGDYALYLDDPTSAQMIEIWPVGGICQGSSVNVMEQDTTLDLVIPGSPTTCSQ